MFSMFSDSVKGGVWLEPFAGSGAVGLEALSRGAARVIFNDRDPLALKVLRRNVAICEAEACCEIHQLDVFVFLRQLKVPSVDFVFLDPPHRFGRYDKLLRRVESLDALQADSLIILELFRKTPIDFLPDSLCVARVIQVGSSQLVLIRSKGSKGQQG